MCSTFRVAESPICRLQVEALAENVDAKRAAAESRVQLCKDKLELGRQAVLNTWAEAARYGRTGLHVAFHERHDKWICSGHTFQPARLGPRYKRKHGKRRILRLTIHRLGSASVLDSFRGLASAADWLSTTETAYNDAREREAAERAADVDADGVVKSEALLGRQVQVDLP